MEAPASAGKKSCLVKGLVILAILLLVAAGFWWWQNRPIKPVVLTPEEKQVVERKIEAIQQPDVPKPEDPKYEKGSKEIILTERELNGLLNQNTDLGRSLKFELASNAIHARLEMDLDKDLPLVGGKRLKARSRFIVGESAGHPMFTLDDVTVWGISLPNDWLGGLKGQDLLGNALGGGRISGVEEFRVETGKLIIRLAE
jgi:hypothetical protein